MTESLIQTEIIAFLKVRNCLVFRMNSGMAKYNLKLAPNGTPDILTITPKGRLLWLEVKTETGILNTNQEIMHDLLRQRNQEVFVVRSVNDVKEII
jgi:hypothetical protein